MARARSARDEERRSMGLGAIYTARRAAELAPWGGTDEERLEDLRRAGLVRTVKGREVVTWASVVAWVEAQGAAAGPKPEAPKPTRALPRAYPL
jgi:hypothetical protein